MIVIFLIIVAVVIYYVVKDRNESKPGVSKSKGNSSRNSSANSRQIINSYNPTIIQRTGIQVLESANIIATSKAIDTVQGRYTFILQILDTLKAGQNNPRYISDIQKSIDSYKGMYYERIPTKEELAILLKPGEFDITDFYCNSLLKSFKSTYQDQFIQIETLKRDDAKSRRREKVYELLITTKEELRLKCSNTKSYSSVILELDMIESELKPKLSQTFLEQPVDIQGKFNKKKTKEGEYILNRDENFELTLINADEVLGNDVKLILDDANFWDNKKKEKLAALFSEHNLKVKEVEAYKKKYGKLYHNKLQELKNSSEEWKNSMEKDRNDILEDFREEALNEIYEIANCDLIVLFEKEPKDITLDDELIKEFGFENLQTYLRFADNLDKVRVIANDNYNRPRFEKLVELGLAIRGQDISMEEILGVLTLKDLNDLAKNPEKEFKRKNQAIEYILIHQELKERLGMKVSFRELFKLKSLPEKYSNVNLHDISDAWKYTYEVVSLLVETYRNSKRAQEDLRDKEYVKGYNVDNFFGGNQMCPCAKELSKKKFTKSKPPKIPYHIGCNCHIDKEYDF